MVDDDSCRVISTLGIEEMMHPRILFIYFLMVPYVGHLPHSTAAASEPRGTFAKSAEDFRTSRCVDAEGCANSM
jgi:hypothetical protein